jgi:sugar lactone lactonase YvrE
MEAGVDWRGAVNMRVRRFGLMVALMLGLVLAVGVPVAAADLPMYAGEISLPGTTPRGVAVGPDGTFYVAEWTANRVERFSADGTLLGAWGSAGTGDGQFQSPCGVVVASDGTVYVADSGNNRIQYFTATGGFLGKWGSAGTGNGQFSYPSWLAIAPDDTIYVTDAYNNRIQQFDLTGRYIFKFGTLGPGPRQYNYPNGIGVTSERDVCIADTQNYRVQVVSPIGFMVTSIAGFARPVGLAIGPDDSMYVGDVGASAIAKYSSNGTALGSWGSFGTGPGQFVSVLGVAVGPDETVYVADGSGRVQWFRTRRSDTVVPTTAISGGPFDAWTNSAAFSLEATDGPDGSGVAHTYYSLNGGDPQPYAGGDVTISTEGVTTISYWSVDNAGNTEAAKTATAKLDVTAPAVSGKTTSDPNAAGWYRSDVSVHFSAEDALSGIKSVSDDVLLSAEGANQQAQGSAVDNAGNSANATVGGINIDKTAPAITIDAPADGARLYLHQAATANWSVTDALSGVATTTASVADGAALDTSSPGTHTVTVSATDAAGNTAEKTVSYVVVTPTQLFRHLLAFYDVSVADGTLAGTGRCPKLSAGALRVLIVLASDCNDAYGKTGKRVWLNTSIDVMRLVSTSCDGVPTDLVTGTNREELARRVSAVSVALGKQ